MGFVSFEIKLSNYCKAMPMFLQKICVIKSPVCKFCVCLAAWVRFNQFWKILENRFKLNLPKQAQFFHKRGNLALPQFMSVRFLTETRPKFTWA